MTTATPWPKCTVTMRDGAKQAGEVAHIGTTHITVRLEVSPWETAGVFGREAVTFTYKDFAREYVEIAT